jgi:hypothetical protein
MAAAHESVLVPMLVVAVLERVIIFRNNKKRFPNTLHSLNCLPSMTSTAGFRSNSTMHSDQIHEVFSDHAVTERVLLEVICMCNGRRSERIATALSCLVHHFVLVP